MSSSESRKQALSSIDRLLSRTIGVTSDNKFKVEKRKRTAASKKAKKMKAQKQLEINAQLNPDEHKREKLLQRKRNAAAITSWDTSEQIEELKDKVCLFVCILQLLFSRSYQLTRLIRF